MGGPVCQQRRSADSRQRFGHLVATVEDPTKLWFVGKRGWRKIAEELDLETYKVVHEPKFMSENVVLYSLERKPKYQFIFHRGQSALVKRLVGELQHRLAKHQRLEPPQAATPAIES